MALVVGARFHSFQDVESALEEFEKNNFTKLWKRDSRKIATSRITRNINEKLIYYEIKYTCLHGGKKFVPTGKGIRESSTFKKDCPMFIQFRASSDGNALEIKAMDLEHRNHETSKVSFMHYPGERRLPPDVRNEAKNLLAMKANKKILQQKLQEKTGKIITLRDLTNIQTSLNTSKSESLEKCVKIMRTQYSANVAILKDEKDNFQGLFAQTPTMKMVASAYPEFLAIDATYKLLKISVPLYLIITEDGACQTEIVAMCLLTNEDKHSLSWFLSMFKDNNPKSKNTKCIITDKDMNERQVIKQVFPEASLIICIFHSLKTFRREVTCEKMRITQSQRIQCLELFEKLLYARTDQEFTEIEFSLYDVAPKPVKDYYTKSWRNIRNEWNMNENFLKSNFLNNTNNRLESLNSKLKSVITKNSSLEDFIHGFFTVVNSVQQERDHKAIYALQKQICSKYSTDSDEYKYFHYLTREAAKYVIKEIEQSTMTVHENNDQFTIRHQKQILHVTKNCCSCAFYISMILPCRHIFAVRKHTNRSLFDKALIEKRWTLEYFKANHRVFIEQDIDAADNDNIVITTQPSSSTLSYAQKRKKALSRTDILADLCAQRSNMLYEQRSQVLDNLISYWKSGQNVCVQVIDDVLTSDLVNNLTNEEEAPENANEAPDGANEAPDGASALPSNISADDSNNYNKTVNKIDEAVDEDLLICALQFENALITDKDNNNVSSTEKSKDNVSATTSSRCTTMVSTNATISTIKMPGNVKQRGRPKGQDVTVIGLPKKTNKSLPYSKLPILEKQNFLMKLFVSDTKTIIDSIEEGHLIDEQYIEIRPENISHAVMDDEVDLHIIRKFFTHDGWKAIEEVTGIMKNQRIWICSNCHHDIGEDPSICCDLCLMWRHLKCVNLKSRPKRKHWFCQTCSSKDANTSKQKRL